MDGLTRRRGARMEQEQQKQAQQATAGQPLAATILPIPMTAVAMSGLLFIAATMFMVCYHVFFDDDEDDDE